MTTAKTIPKGWEKPAPDTEFAPFSFSKKSVVLSEPLHPNGEPTLRSNISDLLMSSLLSTPPSSHKPMDELPRARSQLDAKSMQEIDYDDRIRFPRISKAHNYVYSVQPPQTSHKRLVSMKASPSYRPAIPYLPATPQGLQTSPMQVSIKDYMDDNQIYERQLSNKSSGGQSNKWKTNGIYEMKKPMLTPVALRKTALLSPPPIDTFILHDLRRCRVESGQEEAKSPDCSSLDGSRSTPSTDMSEIKSQASIPPGKVFTTEPTRVHWHPNTGTNNYCMRCFKNFGNPLISRICLWIDAKRPLIEGRHHCRFCGTIVCRECLAQTEDTEPGPEGAIVLDEHARFVITIHTAGHSPMSDYRLHKICKHCATLYHHILCLLNGEEKGLLGEIDAASSEYIFIMNPHISSNTRGHHTYPADSDVPSRRSSVMEERCWSSF